MIDRDRQAIFVDHAEKLDPELVQRILGELATAGAEPHLLPRTDIRVHLDKPEDPLIALTRSLPEEVDYGTFRYQELLDFALKYFEDSDMSPKSITVKITRLWSHLLDSKSYGIDRSPVVDLEYSPLEPPIQGGLDWASMGYRAADPRFRNDYLATLTPAVDLLRQYEPQARPGDPSRYRKPASFYGVGRDAIEAATHFALSRVDSPSAIEVG